MINIDETSIHSPPESAKCDLVCFGSVWSALLLWFLDVLICFGLVWAVTGYLERSEVNHTIYPSL